MKKKETEIEKIKQEFKEKYPEVALPDEFFKMVGLLPPMTIEEEEEKLREIIRKKC